MKIIKNGQRPKIVLSNEERVYLIENNSTGVAIYATHIGVKRELFSAPNLVGLVKAIRKSGIAVEKIYC